MHQGERNLLIRVRSFVCIVRRVVFKTITPIQCVQHAIVRVLSNFDKCNCIYPCFERASRAIHGGIRPSGLTLEVPRNDARIGAQWPYKVRFKSNRPLTQVGKARLLPSSFTMNMNSLVPTLPTGFWTWLEEQPYSADLGGTYT